MSDLRAGRLLSGRKNLSRALETMSRFEADILSRMVDKEGFGDCTLRRV